MNAIFALDSNNGIGINNSLPWPKNNEDMSWFRQHTLDSVILMGRKTWESIGEKPLPRRDNVVISNQSTVKNCDIAVGGTFPNIEKKINKMFPNKQKWLIGGAQLFNQWIPFCEKIVVTRFQSAFSCDVFVDFSKVTDNFNLVSQQQGDGILFQIWEK